MPYERPKKRIRRNPIPRRNYAPKPETKFKNTNSSSAGPIVNHPFAEISASASAQGRVGRKIKAKSLEYMVQGQTGQILRVVCYVPKEQADELTLTSVTDAVDNNKFWVLKDSFIQPQGTSVPTILHETINLPYGMNIEYDGDLSTAIVRNGPKLCIRVVSGTEALVSYQKIWYTDN